MAKVGVDGAVAMHSVFWVLTKLDMKCLICS